MRSDGELKDGGKNHTHRMHMVNRYGYIICGKNKDPNIEYTNEPDLVNCKSCLYKMAKISREQ